MLLQVNSVSKYMKDKKILNEVSCKVYEGERIGLIGHNGVGKSTLVKIIMGEIPFDEGAVKIEGKIGYLPQDVSIDENEKVSEFLKQYEFNEKLMEVLRKLKLKEKYEQKISTLSGGEKTRLYIARMILSKPNLLILDEPTNHLDYEGIQWLTTFIEQFRGGILIISHDRYFLEKTVTKIWELEKGSIKEYGGSYSFYRDTKRDELEREMMEYEKYRKKKKQLEIAARKQMERANRFNSMSQNDFYRGKAAKVAKRSKAILSRLDHIEEVKKPEQSGKINLFFDEKEGKTGNILVRGEALKKAYDKVIFENISFEIPKKKRIGIIGRNGAGKTTLLKAILGLEKVEGKITVFPSAKIGYFSQELKNIQEDNSILEEIREIRVDQALVRNLLACMLFKEDDVYKKIGDLSLGEKVRIIFLKLVLGGYNLLILDEPTNFLDIISREVIEDALSDYKGAILFVSHDQYFIRKMADEIWEMEQGGLTVYLGNYEYYLQKKKEREYHKDQIDKEAILALEMELSNLSFKLLSCREEEKAALEKKYFDIVKSLRELKEPKKSM